MGEALPPVKGRGNAWQRGFTMVAMEEQREGQEAEASSNGHRYYGGARPRLCECRIQELVNPPFGPLQLLVLQPTTLNAI